MSLLSGTPPLVSPMTEVEDADLEALPQAEASTDAETEIEIKVTEVNDEDTNTNHRSLTFSNFSTYDTSLEFII